MILITLAFQSSVAGTPSSLSYWTSNVTLLKQFGHVTDWPIPVFIGLAHVGSR